MRGASPSPRLKPEERNTRYCFDSEYRVKPPTRKERAAAPGPLEGQELIGYGDCLKTEGSGPGICLNNSRREKTIPLDRQCTVFQVEIMAILACALENNRRRYAGRRTCICSDSQTVLKALEGCTYKTELVKDCRTALRVRRGS